MKQRLAGILLTLLTISASPALAQEDAPLPEARLQGYTTNVELEKKGTAVSWMITLVMAAACVGVMFKSAKRSHLD